ncbi:SMI1/KNR4 family protein [Nannocystis radixulma]|uniref:SMI1/KNR4 family protein n=1 Tax=Nannocystis radixulma TaxID=2995305 RepID=A0ABT5B922_9BACT|nr:SMI1/KNR4 family protein [Nannocystis radixulma]MDC0670633.1 SMI1/KNR4 family protein [Nannocystis radixulma]
MPLEPPTPLAILLEELPAGDARFRLELVSPPTLQGSGALAASMRVVTFGEDGAIRDLNEAEWYLASAAHMGRPARVAAYLAAWIEALPMLVDRIPADPFLIVTISDLVVAGILDDERLQDRHDFATVLGDPARTASIIAAALAAELPPDLETSWEVIESWLEQNAPEVACSLRSSAHEDDLAALAMDAGASLPPAFIESWRRHDGTTEMFDMFHGHYYLMPIAELHPIWTSMRTGDGRWQPPEGYRPGWMPIATSRQGQLVYLTLDGEEAGELLAESGTGVERIASSLEALFSDVNALLVNDVYEYSEDIGGLVRRT